MLSTVRERSGSTRASVPMKRQRLGLRVVVRARDVVELAVGDVLQAAGHAGRAVVLHVRHVDDLRELLGDHPDQVRARVVLAEEVGLDVDVRVEAEPGVGRFDADAGGHELVVLAAAGSARRRARESRCSPA